MGTVVKAVTPFTASSPTPTPFWPTPSLREPETNLPRCRPHHGCASRSRRTPRTLPSGAMCPRRPRRTTATPSPPSSSPSSSLSSSDRPVHLDGWALTPSSRNTSGHNEDVNSRVHKTHPLWTFLILHTATSSHKGHFHFLNVYFLHVPE